MIGQNLPPKIRKPPGAPANGKDLLYRLEISTDDGQESDTVALTYPRTSRKKVTSIPVAAQPGKKVRFLEAPKSALKKPTESKAAPVVTEDSSADDGSSGVGTETDTSVETEDEAKSSEQDQTKGDDPEVAPQKAAEQVKTKKNGGGKAACRKEDTNDSEPHPMCPCASCIAARREKKRLLKAKKRESTDSASVSEVEAAGSSATESPAVTKKQKGKRNKPQAPEDTAESTEALETSEATQTEEEAKSEIEAEEAKGSKGKGNGKVAAKPDNGSEQTNGIQGGDATQTGEESLPPTSKKAKKPKKPRRGQSTSTDVVSFAPLKSELHQPNLVLPPRSTVLQVEHAVETASDPRPNAFMDNSNGILRVYHGPMYGNAWGALYSSRAWPNQPLPHEIPHNMNNQYYPGFNGGYGPPGLPANGSMPPWPMGAPAVPYGPPGMYPGFTGPPGPPRGGPPLGWGPVDLTFSPKPPAESPKHAPKTGSDKNKGKDKEKCWDTNVGPTPPGKNGSGKTNSHRSDGSKKSSRSKHGQPPPPPNAGDSAAAMVNDDDGLGSNNNAAAIWDEKADDAWGGIFDGAPGDKPQSQQDSNRSNASNAEKNRSGGRWNTDNTSGGRNNNTSDGWGNSPNHGWNSKNGGWNSGSGNNNTSYSGWGNGNNNHPGDGIKSRYGHNDGFGWGNGYGNGGQSGMWDNNGNGSRNGHSHASKQKAPSHNLRDNNNNVRPDAWGGSHRESQQSNKPACDDGGWSPAKNGNGWNGSYHSAQNNSNGNGNDGWGNGGGNDSGGGASWNANTKNGSGNGDEGRSGWNTNTNNNGGGGWGGSQPASGGKPASAASNGRPNGSSSNVGPRAAAPPPAEKDAARNGGGGWGSSHGGNGIGGGGDRSWGTGEQSIRNPSDTAPPAPSVAAPFGLPAKTPDIASRMAPQADNSSGKAGGHHRRSSAARSAPGPQHASPDCRQNWGPASHGGIMPGTWDSPKPSLGGVNSRGGEGSWKASSGGPPQDQSAGAGGNAVPSWHDPTVAQSSTDPPAFGGGGDGSGNW